MSCFAQIWVLLIEFHLQVNSMNRSQAVGPPVLFRVPNLKSHCPGLDTHSPPLTIGIVTVLDFTVKGLSIKEDAVRPYTFRLLRNLQVIPF
jgi:hypothetical protein